MPARVVITEYVDVAKAFFERDEPAWSTASWTVWRAHAPAGRVHRAGGVGMKRKPRRPGEFELIARYFAPLASAAAALGLVDDAARLRPRPGDDLVVTTDLIAAGVHFFADDPPESIARRRRSG